MRLAVGRLGGGARFVSSEIASRTVSVEYEPATVTVEAIRDALRGVGYESSVVG